MKSNKRTNKRRKLPVVITAGVMAVTLLAGSFGSFANPAGHGFIGEAKAKQIALTNAGLQEKDVTFVRTGLDFENGRYEYDVEFYKGNVEYDYEIDAKTGKILEVDKDIEDFVIPGSVSETETTLEEAKTIALKHAGLKASQVTFVKAELDKENGKAVYDIEFYKGKIEYDYEIDAKTGKILKFDLDIDNYVVPGSNLAQITVDKAKEIALKHVGLKASEVTFLKAELDEDDGVLVYDIEFYKGNTEYDFEINAKTGKIVEFDKDIDGFVVPGNKNNNAAQITVEKAKEIALKYAALNASQVTFTKAKLDKDDGRWIYDVEFYAGNTEYDFEIDAKNGKILEFDYDIEGFVIPNKNNNAAQITVEKAKEIALKYAGLNASQVTFTKAKLDKDDGRWIYDVEFYAGSTEYDFEIDAKNGRILDYDYEVNNDWDNDWDDEDDRDEDWDD